MRTLFAGPYPGEFGWELCLWNPFLRRIAPYYDRVIVAAPTGSRHLYEFAHEFAAVEVEPGTSDFTYGKVARWIDRPTVPGDATRYEPHSPCGKELVSQELERFARFANDPRVGAELDPGKRWRSLRVEFAELETTPTHVREFIRHAYVACAFRPEKVLNGRRFPEKAYPAELCAELVYRLLLCGLEVACIGGPDNLCPPGATDFRGAPLEVQCALLSAARVAVGPSSGPLHLAQLCERPVVSWYDRPEWRDLYSRYAYGLGLWNPFSAPFRNLGRRPTPAEVAEAVKEFCS